MIVLDASILIAYLNADDVHNSSAEAFFAGEVDEQFGVNPLTLAEVLVGPVKVGRVTETRAILSALEIDELVWPAVSSTALAALRAESSLKMPDCCVLLSALDARAAVASYDQKLLGVAAALGLVTHGQEAGAHSSEPS